MSVASRFVVWVGLAVVAGAMFVLPYAPPTLWSDRFYDFAGRGEPGADVWALGRWFLDWGYLATFGGLVLLLPSFTVGDPRSRVGRILAVAVAVLVALALVLLGAVGLAGAGDSTDPDETRVVALVFLAGGAVLVLVAVLAAVGLAGWLGALMLPMALVGLVGSGSVLVQNQVDGTTSLLVGAFVLPLGYAIIAGGLVAALRGLPRQSRSSTPT